MKKNLLRISVPTIALGLLLVYVSIVTAKDDQSPVTSQDLSILKIHNITLKKPTSAAAIPEFNAIEIASKFAPGMASTAKSITTEYQLMTNPGATLTGVAVEKNSQLKKDGHLNDTPVYIVTFKGVSLKGHDVWEGKAPTNFTEDNVIVDATTGEVIASYSYK
ncbi:MAG: hypothetical protein J7639_30475 [Paenibacillaceae bacterium]|nr:hypothetical protein [Paenibacillaceae bacterium]